MVMAKKKKKKPQQKAMSKPKTSKQGGKRQ